VASSLAAAIKDRFGITANLKEGHGGIFEVAINAKVVYSNDKVCGRLPKTRRFSRRLASTKGTLCGPRHMLTEQNKACQIKAVVQNMPPGVNLPTAHVAEVRAVEPLVKAAIRRAVTPKVALPDEAQSQSRTRRILGKR